MTSVATSTASAATAVGGQKYSQIFNEGRTNNITWDGVWFSETQLNDQGYTVELAIPFKTLRFSRERKQVCGGGARIVV